MQFAINSGILVEDVVERSTRQMFHALVTVRVSHKQKLDNYFEDVQKQLEDLLQKYEDSFLIVQSIQKNLFNVVQLQLGDLVTTFGSHNGTDHRQLFYR